MTRPSRMSPSLILLIAATTVAASVNHFISPDKADRASRAADGYGNSSIQTGPAEYPRQAIDSDSYVVKVARPSRRIVSQYWSIDEYVYSVVPPDRIVAVSESAYREQSSNVYPQVERYRPVIASDPEKVLRLNPDLMIVSNSSRADFCAIVRSAQIPIYRTFTMFTTLEQVAETIRATGYLTGEDRSAADEVDRFWSEIHRAKARRPAHATPPRILGINGSYSYGDQTLFHDIVRTLGAVNVGAEGGLKGYDEVNSEQIVRWNPEWIVAGADKGETQHVLSRLLADPGIALTQAARNGHILVFEHHMFLPLSPFARLFVTALADAFYG